MQTIFHQEGLDSIRAPDEPFRQRYNGTGENLDALKARSTPMDITNPYTSAHASCAQAFVATAMSIEHRYSEMEMQIPLATMPQLITASTIDTFPAINHVAVNEQPNQLTTQVPKVVETEFQWNGMLTEMEFNILLPELELAHPAQPTAIAESTAFMQHFFNDAAESVVISEPARPTIESKELIAESINVDDKVQFSGSAPVGTLVQFYVDEVLVGSTECDNQGYWQFMPPSSLPAATYTFSAVVANENGAITARADLSFIIKPLPDVSLTLIDDSDLAQIDIGLIDLMIQRDEMPTLLAPVTLTAEMLEGWQTQDGISSVDMMSYGDALLSDEWESAHVTWH